jgi:hypothetical protein
MVAALTADGSPKVVVVDEVAPGFALAVALGVALALGVADVVAVDVALAGVVAVALVVGLASLAETSEVDAFTLGVELTDGVGDEVGVAVLLAGADPLGVGDGVPVAFALAGAVEVPVYTSLSSTGRKASLAVVSIRLTTLVAALPGTVTVIWSLPCVWT